jgi:ribosomal protein L3 glutamine methyltransferase
VRGSCAARRHLEPGGILVVEVGNTEDACGAPGHACRSWLEFERGGGGVFLLSRETLVEHARDARN